MVWSSAWSLVRPPILGFLTARLLGHETGCGLRGDHQVAPLCSRCRFLCLLPAKPPPHGLTGQTQTHRTPSLGLGSLGRVGVQQASGRAPGYRPLSPGHQVGLGDQCAEEVEESPPHPSPPHP